MRTILEMLGSVQLLKFSPIWQSLFEDYSELNPNKRKLSKKFKTIPQYHLEKKTEMQKLLIPEGKETAAYNRKYSFFNYMQFCSCKKMQGMPYIRHARTKL